MPSVRAVGDRVEELLDLYGEGLARIAGLLRVRDPALLDELAGDGLLAGLLVLHDLHPHDAGTRVRLALDRLGTDAEFLGVDDGVARVRVARGRGCGAAAADALLETAVLDAAPELTGVELTEPAALFQIGMGPPPGWGPAAEGRAS